ncbi:ankyrin repeat domain-containing protein [Burkholderia vietnamiensis]|uniref:ankyrin repeat domain-containing protein n=1 Tax=Burkholderia vietnamiensis TaxID=60552 RepID=UPI001CF3E2E6|nr:ankyrin repeat domain-containing protein [Burkholderia vietnamiensis]MCA8448886.1 ankyrin repeat domain-containing protein [Burkholderia vietnamiensis]
MANLRELFASVRNTFSRGVQQAPQDDDVDLSEPSIDGSPTVEFQPPVDPRQPLYDMVQENKLDELKAAFDQDADLSTTNLLHYARSPDMVDYLVEKGGDVNQRFVEDPKSLSEEDFWANASNAGLTPLHFAASGADLPTIERLLRHGAHPEALDQAIGHDDEEAVVRTLLDAGAQPGFSVVQAATLEGASVGTIRMLLETGANPDMTPQEGEGTALWFAAAQGRVDVVEVLLDYGANVHGYTGDTSDNESTVMTVVQNAAMHGQMDVVDKLVERGADPAGVNSLDHEGNHMLARATARGNDRAVDAMIGHGADIDLALKSPIMKDIPRYRLDPRIVAVQETEALHQTMAEIEQEAPAPTEQPAPRRRARL